MEDERLQHVKWVDVCGTVAAYVNCAASASDVNAEFKLCKKTKSIQLVVSKTVHDGEQVYVHDYMGFTESTPAHGPEKRMKTTTN